jgi:hypothetical protein
MILFTHSVRSSPYAMRHPSPSKAVPNFCLVSLALLIGAMAGGGLCGCERMAPRDQFYKKAPPMAFKRSALHGERDLIFRWRSKAYGALKVDPMSGSSDQKTVLGKYGQPDFARRFRAAKCEMVTEWVFLDADVLVQFVRGSLAYSGPVTDFEKLLIDRGYPNEISRVVQVRGPERVEVIYWTWLHGQSETYSFADGYLVGMNE